MTAFQLNFDLGGADGWTYLGGSASEGDLRIATDAMGHVYVTGLTRSSDFPVVNAAQPSHPGLIRHFVTKMSVPPSCGPEVTTEVEIFNSSFYPIFWPLTLRLVVVRNGTTMPIAGPLTFVIDDLKNAVFVGSSQITRCLSPDGDPVMLVGGRRQCAQSRRNCRDRPVVLPDPARAHRVRAARAERKGHAVITTRYNPGSCRTFRRDGASRWRSL